MLVTAAPVGVIYGIHRYTADPGEYCGPRAIEVEVLPGLHEWLGLPATPGQFAYCNPAQIRDRLECPGWEFDHGLGPMAHNQCGCTAGTDELPAVPRLVFQAMNESTFRDVSHGHNIPGYDGRGVVHPDLATYSHALEGQHVEGFPAVEPY